MSEYNRLFVDGDLNLFLIGQAQFVYVFSRERLYTPSFQPLDDGDVNAFICVNLDSFWYYEPASKVLESF